MLISFIFFILFYSSECFFSFRCTFNKPPFPKHIHIRRNTETLAIIHALSRQAPLAGAAADSLFKLNPPDRRTDGRMAGGYRWGNQMEWIALELFKSCHEPSIHPSIRPQPHWSMLFGTRRPHTSIFARSVLVWSFLFSHRSFTVSLPPSQKYPHGDSLSQPVPYNPGSERAVQHLWGCI